MPNVRVRQKNFADEVTSARHIRGDAITEPPGFRPCLKAGSGRESPVILSQAAFSAVIINVQNAQNLNPP